MRVYMFTRMTPHHLLNSCLLRAPVQVQTQSDGASDAPTLRVETRPSDVMLARLAAVGEDGSVALLPSNVKLDATHAPWIAKIADWCENCNWPPPELTRRKGADSLGCCTGPRR